MKFVRVLHPSYVRSVGEADALRLLAQGWVEPARPLSAKALKHRNLRRNRKLSGYKRFTAYMTDMEFALIEAVRKSGETNAQLLARLLCTGDERS